MNKFYEQINGATHEIFGKGLDKEKRDSIATSDKLIEDVKRRRNCRYIQKPPRRNGEPSRGQDTFKV